MELPEDMDADIMAGPDMMDIMKQTASQLNTTNAKRPDLLPQSTMNVTNHDNALIGRPINYEKSASPNPARRVNFNLNDNAITAGPTINIGGYKEETPMMFDDENYDVKDDLTKEQQKDGMLKLYQMIIITITMVIILAHII